MPDASSASQKVLHDAAESLPHPRVPKFDADTSQGSSDSAFEGNLAGGELDSQPLAGLEGDSACVSRSCDKST